MIRISSDHALFSWIYINYKSFIVFETDGIPMATQNRIFFKLLIHEFYTLFDNTFPEGQKLNLLNINIIQS